MNFMENPASEYLWIFWSSLQFIALCTANRPKLLPLPFFQEICGTDVLRSLVYIRTEPFSQL
jgi:hypothetical protein